ncbi:MAG: substrate-binding domain-containing protein, partial [Thermodesulfobacteriota bacterium]
GTKRFAVMHNDFIIVGPPSDPAGIKGQKSAAEVLKRIAAAGAGFVSRGDDSGTHAKEQELWKATGLPLKEDTQKLVSGGKETEIKFVRPAGDWYMSIGQGMGKTLSLANEKLAYTLADRGTYVNMRYGVEKPVELEVLGEGDPILFNPYGVIPVNPKKYPHVKYDLALQMAQWLVSERGQRAIAGFKLQGQQLFFPDAIPGAK